MNAVTLQSSTPIGVVLGRLLKVRSDGHGGFTALCPAHEDRSPSLSVKEGTDGRVLLKCHAGCTFDAILHALQLEPVDLFPPRESAPASSASPPSRAAMVKSYDYTDVEGRLLYQACRFVDSDGKKTFRQRRPDGNGGWTWSLGDTQLVLYNLPAVMAAVESGRQVFVVEGEKDVDELAALGYVATTNPLGAGKFRPSMAQALRGADVVILPDNDDPGRAHALQVATMLDAELARVRIVELPDLPPKGDVSDWLANGGNLDALARLVREARRWSPNQDDSSRTRWRLDELLENDDIMRPPTPVVPRLAWLSRSTALIAREKMGKSTLTGFITMCVSTGRPFLGDPCTLGTVLVIGLEEFIGDTARRLQHFGADAQRVYLVDRFVGEAAMRPAELRAHIAAVTPKLVIIDSLTAYSHGQITDDNNATQMAAVVQPLTDVVHQLGTSLIVIHHATKATGKSRGSTAITAAVDVVCEFETPDEDTDPTLRRVRSVGRVPVPRLYDVRFDGDTYVLASETEAPLDERIVAVVADRPNITANGVANAIPVRRTEVLSRIAALLASGRLSNIGKHSKSPKLVVPGRSTLSLEGL